MKPLLFILTQKNLKVLQKPRKYERNKTIKVHIFPDLIIDLNEVFEE
jgi:hypothetical protein